MIEISRLYCGATGGVGDVLRYDRPSGRGPHLPQSTADRKPVVVWNCTKQCNLRCRHCYSASTHEAAAGELTTDEARTMIDDLAAFGVPVVLFSGGEPLLRADVFDLIARAHLRSVRTVLSTNGTLIGPDVAGSLAKAGLDYVGVSLDGLRATNDAFRGVEGAFDAALAGIRNCKAAGLKVGLRLTMTRHNLPDIPAIFDLVKREEIPRVCFYHLVYTGRGRGLQPEGPTHDQIRRTLDLIMDHTAEMHAAGSDVQVLTVDNHADGPNVYLRLLREEPVRANECLKLLKTNGGNSSGVGIGCVSWNGDVLPDQFWRQHVLGNVRRQSFSEVWTDPKLDVTGLLARLRDRGRYLKCRCVHCRFLDVCNGNFRPRAEAACGDPWGDDPACYLTDQEIG